MKKYEIQVLKKGIGFGSAKDELAKEVTLFLNKKAAEGYEVINVSFTYYEGAELVAFITMCR